MPIWLQIALSVVLLSAFVRTPQIDAASVARTPRLTVDALWRRFTALESILASQSRRFADVDATLGVVALFELTAAFWFLDKAYAAAPVHAGELAIGWAMAAPILVALATMRLIGGTQAPDALDFVNALEQDEEGALREALGQMVDAFETNRRNLRGKEMGVNLAMALFGALLLADAIGHSVQWW